MTAERIDMADPDNLLLLDTEAVNSSLASGPIEQNEPACASHSQTENGFSTDTVQHPNPASESLGILPVSLTCQDETTDIHSQNIQKEENLAHGTLIGSEVVSLTEQNKQKEMSKDAILNQYASFESFEQPLQMCETDATSSESVLQNCLEKLESVDATMEAVIGYKTLPEINDEAQDVLCCNVAISETPNIENPKTDAGVCVAEANVTHASLLLDFCEINNILETADTPVNDIQMIQDVNKDLATPNAELSTTISTEAAQNLRQVSDHDKSESNTTNTILDKYTMSKGVRLEVCKMTITTNNNNPMVYAVSDIRNAEQSLGQSFSIANNEPDATNFESLIQSSQDTHESLSIAATACKTLSEMHDRTEDLTCGSFTISERPNRGHLKTDIAICLAEADTPNLTHVSILLDSLRMNNILEAADVPVNEGLVTPNAEFSSTHLTHMFQNLEQSSAMNAMESESHRTDTVLHQNAKSVGLDVSIMANDDNPMINIVSDIIHNEQCPGQQILIATSSECVIQTFQDTPDVMTGYETLPEMHDDADDLTFCGVITSQIPKIEEAKTDNPSLAELHKADTLNILAHASTLLDSLEMNNSVLETADMPVNDSEIIQSVNKEVCTSTLTQTVLNVLKDSERDETGMECNRINESVELNRINSIDTKFLLEVNGVQTSSACSNDKHALNIRRIPMKSSDLSVTTVDSESLFMPETPQISEKHNSKVISSPKPVTNIDLGKCSEKKEGACLKFRGTERDVEADSELWLDACQFLAGEEYEGAIFDKCGRSCSPTPPLAHPDNTKASDYSRSEDISIDHQAEDWELRFPPVERWSSSDSWASAFSDWFQAVNTYPEDSFSSADTGSKFSMAIQDNILEQKTSSDHANNTGQAYLSVNLLEPDEPGQALSRGLVESDNTNGTVFKPGDKDGLPSHSDLERQENITMENNKRLLETFSESESCVSSANEFNAKPYGSEHISGELLSAKLEGNALVTKDKVGLVFKDDRESNFPAPRILAYSSDINLTAGVSHKERHRSDVDLCICPSQSDSDASSKVGLDKGNGLCVSNTEDCTVKPRDEEKNTIPQFIMPLAPISTGNTFLHHVILKTDSPQGELDLHPKRTINEINFKSDQKSSSDDSSEDCFHTCPDQSLSSSCGDSDDPSIKGIGRKEDIGKELSKLLLLTGECFMLSEDKRVAYVTLDLEEPQNLSLFSLANCEERPKPDNMPHKTSKTSSDGKTRPKHKEKTDEKQQIGIQTSKKQDVQPQVSNEDHPVTLIETIVITEKVVPKTQGKKKKKHAQHGTAKPENDPPSDLGGKSAPKNTSGKTENLEVKVASNGLNKSASQPSTKMDFTSKDSTQKVISVRPKVETSGNITARIDPASVNATQKASPIKLKVDSSNTAKTENKTCTLDSPNMCLPSTMNDDIKRRRIADDLSRAIPIRTRPQLPAIFRQTRKDGEDMTRRAYSEVVKQKTPIPKEVVLPHVVSEIQADPVPADPQNILLWCQFSTVPPDSTIKWTKEGTVLSEINEIEKDDGRFTMTIIKACSKDLGLYKCSLNAANISVSTSEYHLTSEVLMELVIPSHDEPAEPRVMDGDEENIQCSPLLFKEDFLSDQYFGENQQASIVTEKIHFGEGMHRKAFRTTLTEGNLPRFNPGHPCVLKVHNAIGYGTNTNEELVQKNYSLAVEECHVQNTAREYIKAYNSVAKSAESFGEVPEIIPIYLVHRPSNNIPYATLEEELLGDFVKYSVKDGKEINLMRRDSEAGQKCCAFQHWVYTQTEGNLLVTDMQGVGMKLTDVGIATCKKGYKGFRGNCSTSFIDQFKALHQCNRYCELLGLTSLQPKPKRSVAPPKPKTQPTPKKKPFGPILNGKS